MNKNIRYALILCGPILAFIIYLLVPEQVLKSDGSILQLGQAGKVTAGMTAWMALWWMAEVVPLYITALLPLIILSLTGAMGFDRISLSYGHRIVFLAFGGFMLAVAIEKWHLHKRFSLFVLNFCGTRPRNIIGGFMLASALLSMWISNTATAIIMLPVALSIIKLIDKDNPHYKDFSTCLLLAIAYSCSIGGMGTLVGTGTNMFYAGYTEEILNQPVSFIQWMGIALPVVVVMLPVSWYLMTHFIFKIPNSGDDLHIDTRDIHTMGAWEPGQVLTFAIFILAAVLWSTFPLLRDWPPLQYLSDTVIAVGATFLLFIIPSNLKRQEFLLDWDTAVKKVPWGILLLIGGGLCMARAVSENGIGEYISLLLEDSLLLPELLLIFAVLTLMVFLTEISSNIASVTALSPVFVALALSRNMDPSLLIIPITLAASCAFMLPAATMPNSIVMGSGMVRGWQMARAGFLLNIAGIVIIALRVSFL